MKAIKRIYQTVVVFQLILFMIFIVQNMDNLDSIEFTFTVGVEDFDIEVNFYNVLITIGALFLIIVVAGLTVFGTGLTDEGVRNLAKYIGLFSLLSILMVPSSVYILSFGVVGVIVETLILVIYLVNFLDSIQGGSE